MDQPACLPEDGAVLMTIFVISWLRLACSRSVVHALVSELAWAFLIQRASRFCDTHPSATPLLTSRI
jgi:hypothetical protein